MNLKEISLDIYNLLEEFKVVDLPNYPNVAGLFNQSTTTFVIDSGSYESDGTEYLMNLTLKISVASENRIVDTEESSSLYTLISLILQKIFKKIIKNCRPIDNPTFEITTPESGAWKALLTFRIPAYLTYDDGNGTGTRIQSIIYDYI